MMNKRKIRKIAEQILEQEAIIADENSEDKIIKSAKQKIEHIMSALNFEEILLIDDYIMTQRLKNMG